MTVTVALVATPAVAPPANGLTGKTSIALPPSDLDPDDDKMRVYAGGVLISRDYDPDMEQP